MNNQFDKILVAGASILLLGTGASHAQVSSVGNPSADSSLTFATASPSNACTTTCTIELNGSVTQSSSSSSGWELQSGAASATFPTLVPRHDTKAGIGANLSGTVSIICDESGTATECGRFDESGIFTNLTGAVQIGQSGDPVAVNVDNASLFTIVGNGNPTSGGTILNVDATLAPTSSNSGNSLNGEFIHATFDKGASWTGTLLTGANQSITIASTYAGPNPIPHVYVENPDGIKNNSTTPITDAQIISFPSGDYCQQNGTTSATASTCNAIFPFGSTAIPGASATLTNAAIQLTVPTGSPSNSNSTLNNYGLWIHENCGTATPSIGITFNCYSIYNQSTAPSSFAGPITAQTLATSGNVTGAAALTGGARLVLGAQTYTDNSTAMGGTVASTYVDKLGTITFNSSNTGVTYSNAYTLDVEPPAGTGNVTVTNAYAARFNGQITMNGNAIGGVGALLSANSGGAYINNANCSSTVDSFSVNKAATNTGFGCHGATAGNLSVIIGGTEAMYWTAAGTPFLPGITPGSSAQTGYVCYGASNQVFLESVACPPSLEEYKTNLGMISPDEALKEVMELKPFWGTWNQKTHPDPDKREHPFLGAHQVASVDKRLAVYGTDGKLSGVRYSDGGLVALYAAAFQKQQAEIDTLNARIAKLEAVNDGMRRTLASR